MRGLHAQVLPAPVPEAVTRTGGSSRRVAGRGRRRADQAGTACGCRHRQMPLGTSTPTCGAPSRPASISSAGSPARRGQDRHREGESHRPRVRAVHEPAGGRDVHDTLRDGAPAGRAALRRRRQTRSTSSSPSDVPTPLEPTLVEAGWDLKALGALGTMAYENTRNAAASRATRTSRCRAAGCSRRSSVNRAYEDTDVHGVAREVEAARGRWRDPDDEEHVRQHAEFDVRRQGR